MELPSNPDTELLSANLPNNVEQNRKLRNRLTLNSLPENLGRYKISNQIGAAIAKAYSTVFWVSYKRKH